MKKYVVMLMLCISLNLHASDESFTALWLKSLENSKALNCEKALKEVNLAISLMSEEEVDKFPDIFADRAFYYAQMEMPENAIEEADKALTFENLSKNGKLACYVAKTMSYNRLGNEEELEKSKQKMFEIVPPMNFEYTESHIIVNNIPKGNGYKKFVTCYGIHSRQAENKSKFHFCGDRCFIERIKDCDCGCTSKEPVDFICDNCGMHVVYAAATQESINDCKTWCNYLQAISQPTCERVFGFNMGCVAGCYAVLEGMKNICHKCCQTGDFFRYCVKPFEDFVSKCPCDPFFDN